ncbi:MAG: M16 family metallopeptidase [Thermoguttaceae bacterium]
MSCLMAIACAGVLVSAPGGELAGRIPPIKFEKYVLPNGLEVILHEDHSTPIVGVNVWYHVGSKDERPGRTGLAHLFEHMMFQGSKHYDDDYFGPLQEAGGRLNGSTNSDRTNYWETVPSNYLELALWMESDRMGFLLPAMTQARLDNQRDVVKNERRQSYENRPYGLTYETILAALFPPDHPYSWPTIGSMADLDAASREDACDFFRRYYHPANASLCIAGDFDPAEAKRLVAKYFGPLPAGPRPPKPGPRSAQLDKPQRIHMTDRVGLARIFLAWPTVPLFAPDDAELELLADILGHGKTSRLYRVLVRDKQIAQDVHTSQNSAELAGLLMISAGARPGHSLAELEDAILQQIARIQAEPPAADEIARAVNRREAQLVRALESVSDFGGRADRLNMYNVFTGDPGFAQHDFGRYLKVDPAAVQRAARKYLGDNRVTLEVVPGKEVTIRPDPRQPAAAARADMARREHPRPVEVPPPPPEDADRMRLPRPGPEPTFRLPPIHRSRLSNGMELVVVENHELPSVSVHALFPVGRCCDPADKTGLAALMAAVWDEGTQKRTAEQIADELAGLGATLGVWTDWDATALRLYSLKRHLPAALEIFSDVVRNPAFPEAELDRQRNLALGDLIQLRDEPTTLAGLAMEAALYGQDHPYGRPEYGTPSGLKSVTREALKGFYERWVRPESATLIVVGDTTPAEMAAELEKAFSGWKVEGPAPRPEFPELSADKPARLVLIDKPGAAQSVIMAGLIGARRNSPDYFALSVMNMIFGGQFSSRLNMNLREQKGFTYGARSTFDWRVHQPGPFVASSSVQTAVTHLALVEFLKELEGMRGHRPIDQAELEYFKRYLTRSYPAGFETPSAVAHQLETLVLYGLPDDYFNTFVPNIDAVEQDDVLRAARKYLDLEHLAIVVVGDRAKIERPLRELSIGKNLSVLEFDAEFRLVPAK